MRSNTVKLGVIVLLGSVLVVGSLATNNFGISQAFVGAGMPTVKTIEGDTIILVCFGRISAQAPYELPSWPGILSTEVTPNATAILLVTIASAIVALLLVGKHGMLPKQKQTLLGHLSTELVESVVKTPFKKHKYKSVPELKKHRSYYTRQT